MALYAKRAEKLKCPLRIEARMGNSRTSAKHFADISYFDPRRGKHRGLADGPESQVFERNSVKLSSAQHIGSSETLSPK